MKKMLLKKDVLQSLKEHDPLTYGHSIRVAELCSQFGNYLKLNDEYLVELYTIGLNHDVGKLHVDSKILMKKGKLNNEEYKQILNHTIYGEMILKEKGYSGRFLQAVRSHHENFNGTGYPDKLGYEEINLYSLLLRIVDSYDAMTNTRSYQKALSIQQAINEIQSLKGTVYHPFFADEFSDFIDRRIQKWPS